MNTTIASPAAQVIIAVIPIVGIVIGGTVIFFSLLWRHSEKKLQIKNGILFLIYKIPEEPENVISILFAFFHDIHFLGVFMQKMVF